jgi:diguanylate cyclase (GGDEF)-like protein
MSLILPAAFIALQLAFFALLPAHSAAAAYVVMVLAPLLAGVACLWRARQEPAPARTGWMLLALAVAIWAGGAFANLWHELIEGRVNEVYRSAMLAFNLAIVPVAYLLAGEWGGERRRLSRAIDAVLALALCHGFFLYTWMTLTARDGIDADAVAAMLWLIDAQQVVLAVAAVLRWHVAENLQERRLFRAIGLYESLYLVIVVVNNHYFATLPEYSPQFGSVVTLVFAVLAWAALAPTGPVRWPASPRLRHAVLSARPLLLPGALLIASLFLVRVDYALGVAGVLVAVVGYGLRNAAEQVRSLERGDVLQRERSELQTIAWTDALTGVPNRYFLDQTLTRVWRRDLHSSRPLAVLMIDIDHFKLLNDRYGHPAGDACLRQVARVLQEALVRPGDVLARYGGEEFIALVQDADAAGGQVVAERLRSAVEALRIEHPDSLFGVVTVSIGVASAAPADDAVATALVKAADRALYEAKCAGRNQVRTLAADAA